MTLRGCIQLASAEGFDEMSKESEQELETFEKIANLSRFIVENKKNFITDRDIGGVAKSTIEVLSDYLKQLDFQGE